MYIYAVRDSFSFVVFTKDWVPVQLLDYGAKPMVMLQNGGGAYCPVRFDMAA